METGTMVILLNLDSLYESLYDALNQVCCEAKKYFMVFRIISCALCYIITDCQGLIDQDNILVLPKCKSDEHMAGIV